MITELVEKKCIGYFFLKKKIMELKAENVNPFKKAKVLDNSTKDNYVLTHEE